MAGPDLLGLFAAIATGGSPSPRVLKGEPEGNGLRVSDEVKRREVRAVPEGLSDAMLSEPRCPLLALAGALTAPSSLMRRVGHLPH